MVGSYAGTREYIQLTLTETGPRGHQTEFSVGGAFSRGFSFSQAIENRANGTYTYSLQGCYLKPLPEIKAEEEVCESVGNSLMVTVNGPTPDSVAAQLDDTWEARVGDLDGDGLKDLYLKRTSAAVGGGLLRDVILEQAVGGGFTAVDAPPGSTDAATASTWSLTTAVDVVLNDINLDGFVDILLRGLSSAVGGGALDRMVYAPGRSRPQVVLNAVDDTVTNFLGEVSDWTRDPGYFTKKVTTVSASRVTWRRTCLDDGDGYPDLDDVCYSAPVVTFYSVTVPTNLSAAARAFAGLFDVIDGRIDPDIALGSSAARSLGAILEGVLGARVLNGQLEMACSGSFDYDTVIDIPCNDERLIGRLLLHHGTVLKQFEEEYDPTAQRPETPVGYQRDMTEGEKTLAKSQGLDTITLSRVRIEHVPESLVLEDLKHLEEEEVRRMWYVDDTKVHEYTTFVPEHVAGTNDGSHFMDDFTTEDGHLRQSILIHELVHLHQNSDPKWKYDATVDPVKDAGIRAYGYRTRGGDLEHDDFSHFSKEEQAEIMQDRHLLKNGTSSGILNCREPAQTDPYYPCNVHPTKTIQQMYDELDGLANIPEDMD